MKTAFFWMNLDSYDPCPCGSKKKFKFCCKGKPYQPSPELLADFELGQKLVAEFENSRSLVESV